MMITDEFLTEYAVPVLISLLIIHMIFIIISLGKKHGAGKFGTFILLATLAGGIFGFITKFAVQATLLNVV